MSAMVRFAILGPQRAWYGDRELDLGPSKQRAVLTVLLLHAGRPVTAAAIVNAVWPESPPANGPNVVQKYVAGLRRVFEPDRTPRTPGQLLTLTDAGYVLRVETDALDMLRFEQGIRRAQSERAAGRPAAAIDELRTALSLWQGEPLAGLSGPFFESARHRLVETRATALETRAELALELGQHQDLIAELARLAAEYPFRERLRYLLMLALYRSGRQAEALATYRDIHALLRDEHGLAPGDRLQQLHTRILRSDPSLMPPEPIAATGRSPDEDKQTPTAEPDPAAFPPGTAAVPVTGGPVPAASLPAAPLAAAPLPAAPLPAAPAQPGPEAVAVVSSYPRIVPDPLPIAGAAAAPPEPPRWLSNLGTALVAALALVSIGLLTWLGVLFYAIRRRSGWLALAAVGYLALVLLFLYAMEVSDVDAPPTLLDGVAIIGLAVAWLGGTGHVILINRNLVAMMRGQRGGRTDRIQHERALRREHARYLLHHYPAARHELRIGRPDLPRRFDDGGLVDINSVAESVIMELPGVVPHQRRQIAMDRGLGGPYTAMEDLVARCQLGAVEADLLRQVLVFLPPVSPAPEAVRPLVERPDE